MFTPCCWLRPGVGASFFPLSSSVYMCMCIPASVSTFLCAALCIFARNLWDIAAAKWSMMKQSWSILSLVVKYMIGHSAAKSSSQNRSFHVLIWWVSSWISGLGTYYYITDKGIQILHRKSSHDCLSSLLNRITVEFILNLPGPQKGQTAGSGGQSCLWTCWIFSDCVLGAWIQVFKYLCSRCSAVLPKNTQMFH